MKFIVLLFFPIFIFAQSPSYPDTVFLKQGTSYPCYITGLSETLIKINYGPDKSETSSTILRVKKIVLDENGIIYQADIGFLLDHSSIESFLEKRKQQIKDRKKLRQNEEYKNLKYNKLNLQSGVDLAKGLHVGFVYFISHHLSVETSFGQDFLDLISLSDTDTRFTIGTNWHKGLNSNLVLGVSYSLVTFQNNLITEQYFLSANIGSYSLVSSGFDFFYKFGLLYRYEKDNSGESGIFFPSIELGIRFNLF